MRLLTDSNPESLARTYQSWGANLADLSEQQIRFGLSRCKDFQGYFSLPAFRELCHVSPEDLGLPPAKSAYIEACNKPLPWERQQWSHAAVYHAARETGRFELTNLTETQAFPLFRANYETLCKRVLDGEALHVPVAKMLPDRVAQPVSRDEAKRRCAVLREMIP